MIKNSTLMIFDFNNLLHKSLYAYEGLSYQGKATAGLYGFVSQFCNMINVHKPDTVAVCKDKPPYLRKKIYGGYKNDRKKLEDEKYQELLQASKDCEKFLNLINVSLWEEQGHEADDLIAILCDEYAAYYDKIIIVSNDDDLYQLFTFPNVVLQKGKKTYTKKDYIKEYPNTTTKDWILIKALTGTHNGIPGLKGIGPKTAIKIVKDAKRFKITMEEHGEQIEIFKQIIKLPFLPDLEPKPLTKSGFSTRQVVHYLAESGIVYKTHFVQALDRLQP